MTDDGWCSATAVVYDYNLYSVICIPLSVVRRLSSVLRYAGCSRAETIASHR
jgi:hypothetical protein